MSTFDYLVVAAGLVAQMLAWRSVSRGKREVLSVVPFVLAAMGLVAIVLYPDTTAKVSAGEAALVGAASGIVFWGATRLFVIVADRWAFFRKAVAAAYGQASDTPLARELLLSLLLAVPGEELFWRGFTQQSLALTGIGAAGAALVAVAAVRGREPPEPVPAHHHGRRGRRLPLGRARLVVRWRGSAARESHPVDGADAGAAS
jgi:hypothetical protein